MSERIDVLVSRLRDHRSRRVIFLSHCLLDVNTRYLGGAGRSAAVREVIERCFDADLGIVQMPCPESEAWGGVLKRRMLLLYGRRIARSRLLARVAEVFTRRVYRRLARSVAAQIEDELRAGIEVAAIVGIDGSPSCGVLRALDMRAALRSMSHLSPASITPGDQEALVRSHLRSGRGLFVAELQRELARRGRSVPLLAHDLPGELDGERSSVVFPPAAHPAPPPL